MARKRLLNFIELHDVHIFQQLQYEEILLRSTQKSWCLINKGPIKPVIVTGLSGKIHELVHLEKAKRLVIYRIFMILIPFSWDIAIRFRLFEDIQVVEL